MASKTLKTALDLAQEGNPTRFGEVISQALGSKVLDRLQHYHQEVAKDILKYEPVVDDQQQEALEPRATGEKKFRALHTVQRHAAVGQTDFNGGKGKAHNRSDQDTGDDSGDREDPESTVARLRRLTVHPSNEPIGESVEPLNEKNWIAGAIKHPGALTRSAKAAGESPMEFAREHKHSKGTVGKRARLALTLRKLHK